MVHYQTNPVRNAPVMSALVPSRSSKARLPAERAPEAGPSRPGGRKDGGAVTPQLPLPSGQSSLTPEWLTQVLRQAGPIGAGRVAGAPVDPAGSPQLPHSSP